MDFAFLAEEADFVLPGGDAGAVEGADAAIERDFLRVASFNIYKAKIAYQLRVEFVGGKEVDEDEFVAARLQAAEAGFVTVGVEEIAEEEGQPRAAGGEGVGLERLVEVGLSSGGLFFEIGEQAEGVVGAARGAVLCASSGRRQKSDGDLIPRGKSNGAEGGSEFAGVVEFVVIAVCFRITAPIHGFGRVYKDVNSEVFFFLEEFDERFFQSGVHVPVEVAQVIAGSVIAVIGKLDADPALFRAAVALHRPRADFVRHEGEGVEFAEGGFVEEHGEGIH